MWVKENTTNATRDRSPVKKAIAPTVRKAPMNEAQKNSSEEKKTTVPSLILESDKHWKTLHALMVKKNVESRSKVTLKSELYINAQEINGYRKLQDHLQRNNIVYHTYATEKSNLRVVIRGLPMSTDLNDIVEDLHAQVIVASS